MEWNGYPSAVTFAFLWLVAMLRGQATYWIARAATDQTLRLTASRQPWAQRTRAWLASGQLNPGRRALEHWGVLAVTLCYLTVGIQTVLMAAAGAVRIGWVRFTLAQTVGALAWATIYSTIGFAAWSALARMTLAGHPVLVAAVSCLVGAGLIAWVLVARRGLSARGELAE